MDPNENAAEEKVETTNVGDVTATDEASSQPTEPREEEQTVEENTESFNDGADTSPEGGEAKKQPQSKEENAAYARARRERERQAEIQRTRDEAIVTALGGKNPFTGSEVKTHEDVEKFLVMKAIEAKGGDPLDVEQYAGFLADADRARAQAAKQAEEQNAWYRDDRARFEAEHPDVNLAELIQDENFQAYAEGKVGTTPLSEIYNGYARMKRSFESRSEEKAARAMANKAASPGSLRTGGTAEVFFTREQVAKMTQKEVHDNWEKVQESMAKWK